MVSKQYDKGTLLYMQYFMQPLIQSQTFWMSTDSKHILAHLHESTGSSCCFHHDVGVDLVWVLVTH